MIWISEIEDAKSFDDLILSAFIKRKPIQTSRILISSLQADSRKSSQGISRNKSSLQKTKMNLRSDHIRADIVWMIYDFFKIRGDNEAIFDLRALSKVHVKNNNVQATKCNEMSSSITDRPTDKVLESLFKMQIEESEELKYVVHIYAQETAFGDKKYDNCRLKSMAQRHVEQKIRDSPFKGRNRDEDRPAMGAPNKRKAKRQDKENAKNYSERRDCMRWIMKGQCSFGVRKHSS